jgi:hypothetical protein
MARIRSIKPEFFQHERLYDAERDSGLPLRVAFSGLWTVCDRDGRFEWRPRQLKLNVLPYDELDFTSVLSALESGGFIVRYDVEGKSFGFIPSWHEHQHINVREPSSTIPAPSGNSERTGAAPDEASTCTEPVPDQSAGKGREGKGKGKEGKDARVRALTTHGLDLKTFERWEAYRVEIRKPLKPASLEASATELAKYGGDQAAVVQQSIANGWQGLFALKLNGNGQHQRAPPPRVTYRTADEIEAEERARGDFDAQH